MPNENDGTESINSLAKKIEELPGEINRSKGIFQKTVKYIKKNLIIIVVVLIILTIALVVLVLSSYLFLYTTGYALKTNYAMTNMNGSNITTWVS